jgi:hypothetical protein
MAQDNEYVQRLIAARDTEVTQRRDIAEALAEKHSRALRASRALNQLLKPKGENGSDFGSTIYLSCQTARSMASITGRDQ